MKELCLEDLSLRQKIGMALCADLSADISNGNLEDALSLIREHSLGAVWIQPTEKGREEAIRRIRETADYPILILCDSERGYGDCTIPAALAITAAGAKEEYARSFGRAVASIHSAMGYNVVCNPVLDLCKGNVPCGGSTRSFGPDKYTAARLGAAMARGMHEGGCLTVAKHYPGSSYFPFDSHMRENHSDATKEELLEENLYPYLELDRHGLLDGVMTKHMRIPKVDPEYPASLSGRVLSILRDTGYKGFFITDALNMMGVVLKYGNEAPYGLSVRAGNIALGWARPVRDYMDALTQGYEKGLFSEADADRVAASVLAAQHKTLQLPRPEGALEEDLENVRKIGSECICAVCDPGLRPSISAHGRHLFAIMTYDGFRLDTGDVYTPGPRDWFFPQKIADRLRQLFPNSGVTTVPFYPTGHDNLPFFRLQEQFEDVVFITYYQTLAFDGREHLTAHMVDLMDALQSTDRIAAHVHFGAPHVAEDAPHMPRVLIGMASEESVMYTLSILHGDAEARGTLPYPLKFHEKGYIFW